MNELQRNYRQRLSALVTLAVLLLGGLALTTSFPADKLTEADWVASGFPSAPSEVLDW